LHAPDRKTRRERFFASFVWLILRNLLGWILIVASFVAGPLVPGRDGIPMFLIGFALISFPGKRRLTVRVLRGRGVSVPPLSFALTSLASAVIVPALLLMFPWHRPQWATRVRRSAYDSGALGTIALYLTLATAVWVIARTAPHALNGVIRLMARARHKFRPWLRRHHIRLLPPRWRVRHWHEPGHGPLRIKEEILKFSRDRLRRRR
jgi:hypothetical protein